MIWRERTNPMIRKDPADFTPKDIAELAELHCEYGGYPLITKDDLPTLDDYCDNEGAAWLEGKVSEARYEELLEGADPTDAELRMYHEVWLASVADGNYDSDKIPTCGVCVYENANGETRYAVFCSKGHSFTEVHHWLEKADFTSLEAAKLHLHALTDTSRLLAPPERDKEAY